MAATATALPETQAVPYPKENSILIDSVSHHTYRYLRPGDIPGYVVLVDITQRYATMALKLWSQVEAGIKSGHIQVIPPQKAR